MFQVGDTVRVRTGLAIGDDSLMSCAGRNLHVVAILQGGLVRCRYFHNNHTIDAAIKSEFLMLTATSIPPETKPLVCLNQHPEHQWEDSGLCLARPNTTQFPRRLVLGGSPVEVCSRPGCGLIRVKQQREVQLGTKLQADDSSYREAIEKARESISKIEWKEEGRVSPKAVEKVLKADLGWDNAFGKIEDEEMTEPGAASFSGEFCSRDGYEHGICSCGQPWRVKFAERTVFYCVECGGALVAGPVPKTDMSELACSKCGTAHASVECPAVAEPCITCGRPAVVQTWEMVYSPKSKSKVKLVSYHCQDHAPKNQTGELPQPGDPYPEVRCERCHLLTPVSELSRDAQGRMVCRHH